MQLLYADQEGNIYDHPHLQGLARSGDMVTELMTDELIPLPEGATLVSLPDTRPIGMDPETGNMQLLEGDYFAVGAVAAARFYKVIHPCLCQDRQKQKIPFVWLYRCRLER